MIQQELSLIWHGSITAKKNSKQIINNPRTGRPMIISNNRAKGQEQEMAWEFSTQAAKYGWNTVDADFCHIAIGIWEKDRRRRDLDNQATAILDALVLAGVIPDDNSQYVRYLSVHYFGTDKTDPRANIEIKAICLSELRRLDFEQVKSRLEQLHTREEVEAAKVKLLERYPKMSEKQLNAIHRIFAERIDQIEFGDENG